MAGPWEKYQNPSPDGPWVRYQKQNISEPAQEVQTPSPGGYGTQAFSGWLEGATGALGAPVDLMNNLVVSPALKGVNAVFGTDFQPSEEPLGGSAGLRRGLAIAPDSEDTGPQMARRVMQSVGGASVPLAGSAGAVGQVAAGLGTAAGGGLGGAVAQQLFPGNVGAEIAGELIGGLGTGAAIAGLADRSARRAAEKSVPTVEQLKAQAGEKFESAHRSGVSARQDQTQQLAANIRSIAQQEGLISPTGRVSEAYPKAREALKLVDDYAQGGMSVPQMQTARKVLADAAKSTDDAERRIATLMLRQFDDFTSPLAPQLAEARGLYSRAMRGEQLETLSDLAGARAGQFTGSGYENALRTEYRNLDRRITKGQDRGWSPDQIEAIQRVARGTPASNTMRNIGRMAPTGPVSFGASAGVPFAIGTALTGNPWIGSAMGATTSAAGYGARGVATRMGIRNAEIAELLARGGALSPSNNEAIRKSIIEAILGSQAATQSN